MTPNVYVYGALMVGFPCRIAAKYYLLLPQFMEEVLLLCLSLWTTLNFFWGWFCFSGTLKFCSSEWVLKCSGMKVQSPVILWSLMLWAQVEHDASDVSHRVRVRGKWKHIARGSGTLVTCFLSLLLVYHPVPGSGYCFPHLALRALQGEAGLSTTFLSSPSFGPWNEKHQENSSWAWFVLQDRPDSPSQASLCWLCALVWQVVLVPVDSPAGMGTLVQPSYLSGWPPRVSVLFLPCKVGLTAEPTLWGWHALMYMKYLEQHWVPGAHSPPIFLLSFFLLIPFSICFPLHFL